MNKRTHFILGFLSGAVIFGAVTAFALEVIPNPFPIKLDGKSVNIEGYNIDGKSYFQLRDIGNAVGFTVDWDAENNTVVMETDNITSTPKPTVSQTEPNLPNDDNISAEKISTVAYCVKSQGKILRSLEPDSLTWKPPYTSIYRSGKNIWIPCYLAGEITGLWMNYNQPNHHIEYSTPEQNPQFVVTFSHDDNTVTVNGEPKLLSANSTLIKDGIMFVNLNDFCSLFNFQYSVNGNAISIDCSSLVFENGQVTLYSPFLK